MPPGSHFQDHKSRIQDLLPVAPLVFSKCPFIYPYPCFESLAMSHTGISDALDLSQLESSETVSSKTPVESVQVNHPSKTDSKGKLNESPWGALHSGYQILPSTLGNQSPTTGLHSRKQGVSLITCGLKTPASGGQSALLLLPEQKMRVFVLVLAVWGAGMEPFLI